MTDGTIYTASQAAAANVVLRAALDLPPQQFSIEQFVGMISDEIDQLHDAGKTDEDISNLLQSKAGISVSAEELQRYYADSSQRGGPPG